MRGCSVLPHLTAKREELGSGHADGDYGHSQVDGRDYGLSPSDLPGAFQCGRQRRFGDDVSAEGDGQGASEGGAGEAGDEEEQALGNSGDSGDVCEHEHDDAEQYCEPSAGGGDTEEGVCFEEGGKGADGGGYECACAH